MSGVSVLGQGLTSIAVDAAQRRGRAGLSIHSFPFEAEIWRIDSRLLQHQGVRAFLEHPRLGRRRR